MKGQQYPSADAGADQSVKEGDIVVLNEQEVLIQMVK